MALVIGLLGGIGSGKSAVARAFAARGCLVLDADAEARAVVELPAVRAALVERFGPGIMDAGGRLDRGRLAAAAFADGRGASDLNAIVHPAVRQRLAAAFAAATDRQRPGGPADVVLDVPLLLESPLAAHVTHWLFIEAPETVREARVGARGWPPGERARRESHQASLADKRARADAVLENSGGIVDLERSVDALLLRWRTT
jgi:dephospho-CoA kinase